MELAAEKGTADDALRYLLGLSTIRVEVTEEQRRRWIAAADAAGVPVDDFIRLRIEACLQFGTDGAVLVQLVNGVDALCRQAGLRPVLVDRRPTQQSTANRQES